MADDSSRSDDKFTLRFPPGMRDRLREAARASGRSMNGEIISVISAGLDSGGVVDVDALAARIVAGLVDRLAAGAVGTKPAPRRGRQSK